MSSQWLAANMVVSSFAIGALAIPVFGLGFVDALLTIFFFNLLGVIPVCFFSIFGPKFGLRQIILSRFFFGYYGVKLSKTILAPCRRISTDYLTSCGLQWPGMLGLVFCQCHCRVSAYTCSQC